MMRVWFFDCTGEWNFHSYDCVGEELLEQIKLVARRKYVQDIGRMFLLIDGDWFRVNFFQREYTSDRSCTPDEVPEIVRMKQLLIGD